MNVSGIRFKEETTWNNSREALQIYADIEDRRIVCNISQVALNDYYNTEDTEEQALNNYEQNKIFVHNLITQLIAADQFSDDNEIFITSNDLK